MTKNLIAWVVIVLAGIVGVVMYGNQRAEQALVQRSFDSLMVVNKARLEKMAADSLVLDSLADANTRRDSVEAGLHEDLGRARRTVLRRTGELDEFLATAPPSVIHDTVVVILRGALEASQDEARICSVALAVCDSTKLAQTQQIVILTGEKADLLELNVVATRQLGQAIKSLRPNIFKQMFSIDTGGIIKVVLAFVGGYAVGSN